MKTSLTSFVIFALCVITLSCGQKSHEHDDHQHGDGDAVEESGNQALYDEVMKVHDEVMPKMDDIYKMKEELKNQIANTPDMVEDRKKEIEAAISKLDSASEGMMVWMRNFNPLPDSLGEEQAKEYLENEMEKVKKVKDDVLESLENAKDGE